MFHDLKLVIILFSALLWDNISSYLQRKNKHSEKSDSTNIQPDKASIE